MTDAVSPAGSGADSTGVHGAGHVSLLPMFGFDSTFPLGHDSKLEADFLGNIAHLHEQAAVLVGGVVCTPAM
jgi:hypothetical protein